MGCNATRVEPNPQEGLLSAQESGLHFDARTVSQHLFILSRFSQGSPSLNENAFSQAADSMKIRRSNDPSHPKTETFYNSLKDSEGCIRARDLGVFCVLWSSGSNEDKAAVLFELYDESFTKILPKSVVLEMVQDLIEASVGRVKALVEGIGNAEDRNAVQGYLDELNKHRDEAVQKITQMVVGGQMQISSSGFCENFIKAEGGKLLSSQGIRRYLTSLNMQRP